MGDGTWCSALERLAHSAGSQHGELIGVGADGAVPFNVMTNVDPTFAADFAAIGGGDPAINPRVKAGLGAPPLKVLTESDFITADEYRRNPHVQEVSRRWDIGFLCLTTLQRENGLLIGLAVGRSQRAGHITNEERSCFASVAPHVRAAVRAQMALEGQGSALVAGAMEALAIPAFVCDRFGRVQALTPSAEKLIATGRGLELRQGELRACHPGDTKMLAEAIRQATVGLTKPAAPPDKTVLVRGRTAALDPIVLDVIALPRQWQHEFNFTPRVLVVARGARHAVDGGDARRSALLQAAYRLTASEADIALRLAAGKTAEAIAESRRVRSERPGRNGEWDLHLELRNRGLHSRRSCRYERRVGPVAPPGRLYDCR